MAVSVEFARNGLLVRIQPLYENGGTIILRPKKVNSFNYRVVVQLEAKKKLAGMERINRP
jgi:hypothetical protein